MSKPSQWSPYLDRILQILESTQFSASAHSVATTLDEEEGLNLSRKERVLLRTYIMRQQQKQRKKPRLNNNVQKNQNEKSEVKSWDESSDSATYEYKGERSIKTLEDALAFSEVDLNVWEVERHIFNSWDVAMKKADGSGAFKRTNYQVKVWFRRITEIKIERPKFRQITIDKKDKPAMWLVVGCVHVPFHDRELWDKLLQFVDDHSKELSGVIINGDFLDLRSLSSHDEFIPDGIDLGVEYSEGLQAIEDLEARLSPDCEKIFIYGNHEDRFFRNKSDARKYGSSLKSPHEALELDQKGWQVVTDWKNGYVTLGDNLDVFHGVKVGLNAAKDQLNALPSRSHIFNHTHRFGSFSNKTNSSFNIGCMIDFNSEVFKYVDRGVREAWTHGFAVAYIDAEGGHHVYPIKVNRKKSFFFKGEVY